MREALSSLTSRGRVLLAAGLTASACAVALGQSTLLRVGVLSALLPLLAAAVMARTRYRITLDRHVQPYRIRSGQSAQVTLDVRNEGFAPPGSVLLEDEVGYALGARPRFSLTGLGRGRVQELRYRVSTDVRGKHLLGPGRLRVKDPLGLVEVHRRFRTTTGLVVLPAVVALDGSPGAVQSRGGAARSRSAAAGDSDDTTVRSYRRGDDVRRVHWRSSARAGELMVRNEEQSLRPTTTVVLDTRRAAHRGNGAASSFETAVRVTASVLTHLHLRGNDVHLVLGQTSFDVTAHGPEALETALERLALLAPDSSTWEWELLPPTAARSARPARNRPADSLVAVLGHLDQLDLNTLAGWAPRAASCRALVLEVDLWSSHPRRGGAEGQGVDTPAGWNVAVLGPRTSLREAWRSVSR